MHPYRLAKAGGDVLLVESSDLNTGASGRNAGGFHVRIQFDAFATMGEAWAHEWVATIPLLIDAIGRWQALEAAPALAHRRGPRRAPGEPAGYDLAPSRQVDSSELPARPGHGCWRASQNLDLARKQVEALTTGLGDDDGVLNMDRGGSGEKRTRVDGENHAWLDHLEIPHLQ